jgi:F-type H+-transporting ATPase subunit b
MKRLALLLVLSLGCATWVCAQEAQPEQSNEPSALWKWANFAILAVALGYGISKTLPPFFRGRTGEIQKGIAEAQEIKRDAEKRAAQMDARMNALGAEIEKFRAESRAEMVQEGERIQQETARQMERLEQQMEQEIESAGKAARRELKIYAAQLALDLAEQRVRARLDAPTETALVKGFIHELRMQESNN